LHSPEGPRKLAVAGRLDADDSDVLTTWALAGEGIVLKPVFEVADHLRSGALVPVLRDFPPEPATLAVLHPYRQLVAANVRAFIDFIVDRARAALAKALDGLEP
jgi:DNA-binding transcriptional LysR family regulator